MSHRWLPALTALALLVPATTAVAAPAVGNPTAAPADTAAGAASNFSVAFDVTGLGAVGAGGDDLKTLRLDLPPGLVGNPLATGGTCSEEQLTGDTCPATTKVGTTVTTASVSGLGLPMDIAGDIYNVAPGAGEAARLGIVLRPAGGLLPKVILRSGVTLRSTDGGLTSTVNDIPATAGGVDLRIDRMALTLLGKLDSGKSFMNNPTSCAPATTTITIGTYGEQTATGTTAFTPTACGALPFAPKLTAKIGSSRDDVRQGEQPEVTVVVTQEAGEANARSVAVQMPAGMGAALAALGAACPVEVYRADVNGCPASSVVGSASAQSPLLAAPLTGKVTFVSDPSQGLPTLRVALRGAFAVDLIGMVTTTPTSGLINTIDGIFDVPLNRFVLTIAAGTTSPLSVARDLCLPGKADLVGTFVAHSGATATSSTTAELTGCDAVPASRVSGRVGRSKRPAVRLEAFNADRPVQVVSFRLPKGFSFTARAKKRTKVTPSDTRVTSKLGLRKGRMTVTLAGDGSPSVEVLLRRGAVRATRSARRGARPRMRVGVRLAGRPVERKTVRLLRVKKP